jgi:hypothetical protein
VRIAENLTIVATYNPTDRSALELDAALMRRLRIITCPPDTGQLREMLDALPSVVVDKLAALFEACREWAWPTRNRHRRSRTPPPRCSPR